ncbi:MAG TPA: hypothetical protein PK677_16585 [Acidiphilium sp.]|nr:hypothetical protein [Acidiphilium sp.]
MTAGANKTFLGDPLGFLNTNVIVPHSSLQTRANGQARIINVNLVLDSTGKSCINHLGNTVPMYSAMGAPSKLFTKSNAFKAYYLPYTNNKTKQMNLGIHANFFITDKIDGCTFASGINGGQNPLVVHINKQDNSGLIDQTRIDNKVSRLFGTQLYSQLSLPDYISPEEVLAKADNNAPNAKTHVTVIGIRSAVGWTFYFQRRNWIGGNQYRLIDTQGGCTQI